MAIPPPTAAVDGEDGRRRTGPGPEVRSKRKMPAMSHALSLPMNSRAEAEHDPLADMEAAARRALASMGQGGPAPTGNVVSGRFPPRPRHRFKGDGEVPVVRASLAPRGHAPQAPRPVQPAIDPRQRNLEGALAAERTAHRVTAASLTEAKATATRLHQETLQADARRVAAERNARDAMAETARLRAELEEALATGRALLTDKERAERILAAERTKAAQARLAASCAVRVAEARAADAEKALKASQSALRKAGRELKAATAPKAPAKATKAPSKAKAAAKTPSKASAKATPKRAPARKRA